MHSYLTSASAAPEQSYSSAHTVAGEAKPEQHHTALANSHWKVCFLLSTSASHLTKPPFLNHEPPFPGLVECLADELAPFNIRTLLVEAGMFRTDLFAEGNRKSEPPAIEDYASIHKKQAQGVAAIHGKQAGDPKKAVERILDVVRGEGVAEGRSMPKRLPLGKDTLGIIRTKCEETLKLCEEWEGVATSTDF